MSKIQPRRLGRGLSSLMSMSDLPVEAEIPAPPPAPEARPEPADAPPQVALQTNPTELPVDQISPNPHQPRREMRDTSITDLAASLKSTGLIQPIIVRKIADGYQLIAGERRLRAAKVAGFTTIPAIVRDVDSFTQAQMALVENIQREDLNPIDRAMSYRILMNQLGLTQAELAARLGEDRSAIANFLRLLELSAKTQMKIRDGQLSVGHAKVLAGVTDIFEQDRLAELAVSQDLSVRNLERVVQSAPSEAAPPKPAPAPSAHLKDLETNISRQLGMRVQVKSGAKKSKGRLILHYSNLDQFDDLLQRLGVRTPQE
jgi:ParB family chromosome partitioning protein